MARRMNRMNSYRSRIRRCAMSGLRGYESDMVHVNGKYIIPRFLDKDESVRRPVRRRGHNV